MEKEIKNSEFQYARPIVTNLEFNLNKDYIPTEETKYRFNIKSNINKSQKNSAIVEVTWFTTINDGSINPKYEISISMASNFSWKDQVSDENVDKLLNYNAVSLLLGYIRPVVSVITSNSVEPLDIPFVNLMS